MGVSAVKAGRFEAARVLERVEDVVGVLMGLGVWSRSLSISRTLAISSCIFWMSFPNCCFNSSHCCRVDVLTRDDRLLLERLDDLEFLEKRE